MYSSFKIHQHYNTDRTEVLKEKESQMSYSQSFISQVIQKIIYKHLCFSQTEKL